ncbi:MAG: DUF1559 domain-containing protein [Thermoguttaceae bacterium]|nr:DUF1559 domain-containing protein [Thermoguttaceae bacterium]MDW8078437.1 DUF1559 domain-containing protein [Thermoguttaceae bacterium]
MTQRKGFTLVEMLVVVVIIAMLAGILLPAVLRGREAARRAECLNNQKQLALATQQFENARGQLPGYLNSFGGVDNLTWVIMLLPHLGEQELWKLWRDPNRPLAAKAQAGGTTLPVVKCPSDTSIPDHGLSFVVNCGRADLNEVPGNAKLLKASGLFFNLSDDQLKSRLAIRTEAITDGADATIMLSENLHASFWAPQPGPSNQVILLTRTDVGMLWTVDGAGCSRINQCRDEGDPNVLGPPPEFARPSSAHPGGVNVTFASGRQQFLDEGIDYRVYCEMMAPDDKIALP